MRLWPCEMFPYLPERQFRGQLRELVAIMRDWRDKGRTNHLLINAVMTYPKSDLVAYYELFREEWRRRYGQDLREDLTREFYSFAWYSPPCTGKEYPYDGWINTRFYWRICMANLYEKHLGEGKNRVTCHEWDLLRLGYAENNGGEMYRL